MRFQVWVGLVALAASAAFGQGQPPSRPPAKVAQELSEELGLSPEQRTQLEGDVSWVQGERRKLGERLQAGELEFSEIGEVRATMREELRERLAVYLTPAQLEGVPYAQLVEGPVASPSAWVRSSFTWMPSTSLDDGGRLRLHRSAVEFQARMPLTRALSLSLGLRGTLLRNDFSKAFELDPVNGDPFENLYGARATLGAQLRLGPVFAIASTNVQLAFEEGADAAEGITFGGLIGISYGFSRNFALGLGAILRTRIEEDFQVIPIPMIRLNLELSESWRFLIGAPEGLQLIFEPDPSFTAQAGIGFRGGIAQDVRLDDKGFAPEGIARGRRIPVQLQLRWRPTEWIELGGDVGVFLWQRIQIDDRRGNELTDDRTDPTPFGALSLRLLF